MELGTQEFVSVHRSARRRQTPEFQPIRRALRGLLWIEHRKSQRFEV